MIRLLLTSWIVLLCHFKILAQQRFYFSVQRSNEGFSIGGQNKKRPITRHILTSNGAEEVTLMPKVSPILYTFMGMRIGYLRRGNQGLTYCNRSSAGSSYEILANYQNGAFTIGAGVGWRNVSLRNHYFSTSTSSAQSDYSEEMNTRNLSFPVQFLWGLDMFSIGIKLAPQIGLSSSIKHGFIDTCIMEANAGIERNFSVPLGVTLQYSCFYFEGMVSSFLNKSYRDEYGNFPYQNQRNTILSFTAGVRARLGRDPFFGLPALAKATYKHNQKHTPSARLVSSVYTPRVRSRDEKGCLNCAPISWYFPILNSSIGVDLPISAWLRTELSIEHSNFGHNKVYPLPVGSSLAAAQQKIFSKQSVLAVGLAGRFTILNSLIVGAGFYGIYHHRLRTFSADENFERYASFRSPRVQKFIPYVLFGGQIPAGDGDYFFTELHYLPKSYLNRNYIDAAGNQPFADSPQNMSIIKIGYRTYISN